MPFAVVAAPAPATRDERRAATRPAAPGLLPHACASLPRPVGYERTRIHERGKPLSTAAASSFASSHSGSSEESVGRSQTPGNSRAKSAAATRSASSGRWAAWREPIRAARKASAGDEGAERGYTRLAAMTRNRIAVSTWHWHFFDKLTSPAVNGSRIDIENCRFCPFWEICRSCWFKDTFSQRQWNCLSCSGAGVKPIVATWRCS